MNFSLFPEIEAAPVNRSAVFSPCRRYRYSLTRQWGEGPVWCWVMLNPSTADDTEDDPTIRRVIRFTRDGGGTGIRVVNLYAWRATDPRELRATADPVGPCNDELFLDNAALALTSGGKVVAAWGAGCPDPARALYVRRLLAAAGWTWHILRLNADGSPCHPLYLQATLKPEAWTP